MTRITLNELDETMEEIPAKLMLIINAIDKSNAEAYALFRTLIKEIKDGDSKQYHLSEQLIETISNNANDVATAVKTGIYSRRKAFWQYYLSKQIPNVYKKPLEKNPPQFPRKFLPRMIENETK